MSKLIKSVVSKLLRGLADRVDSDTCELNEKQAIEIMSVIGHNVLSKDEACSYLNLSRSRFDTLVLEGKIPRGKKRRGFKELFWYEDELLKIKNKE